MWGGGRLSRGSCVSRERCPIRHPSRDGSMTRHVHLEAPGHCSERWIRVVDQGWIRVDQGGSAVYHGHILVPRLRKTLKNVGEPPMAQLPAAGRTCPFIKLKERNHVFLAQKMLGRYTGASSWRSRILCSLALRKKGGKEEGNGDRRRRKGRNRIPGSVGRSGRSVDSVGRSGRSVGRVGRSVGRSVLGRF